MFRLPLSMLLRCLILTCLMAGGFQDTTCQAQEQSWEIVLQHADAKRIEGDVAGAEKLYTALIAEMANWPPKSQLTILREAKNFYEKQKDYPKVQSLLEQSMAIQATIPETTVWDNVQLLKQLASVLVQMKSYDKAVGCYELALQSTETEYGMGSKDLLPMIDGLVEVYQLQNKPDQAKAMLQKKQQLLDRLAPCENLPSERYTTYIAEMQRLIKARWKPPSMSGEHQVVLRYVVMQNGRIDRIQIRKSSQNPAMDDSAISALQQVNPLPPLPKSCNDFIHCEFFFDYKIRKKH